MRLAFLGNFDPPDSTENHWRYAFEQHGVDFVPMQINRTSATRWEAAASHADAACLSTSWGWPLPCSKGTWDRLAARGVRTFTVHLDLIMGIPREHQILADRKHPQFFGPEFVWTADGSHDDEWKALGVNHLWLPPAIHAPNAVRGIPRTEWDCDLVFTGSCAGYHPEWPRRKALVAAARDRFGDRFLTIGGDWANAVRGPALADVYASARVVLGDSLCPGFEADRYLSDRVPEVCGRGGLLVHPWNAAGDTFRGDMVSSGWDVDDQLDAVEGVLCWAPSMQEGFRQRAHRDVLAAHTYTHRARNILDTLGFA